MISYNFPNLRQLLLDINNEIDADLRQRFADYKARLGVRQAIALLASIAYSNRANWSGGVDSANNIMEAIARERALAILNDETRDYAARAGKVEP